MIPAHPRYGVLFPERLDLPVYQHKNEFMQLLDSNKCVILIGETGSGKTTQIPQWCLEYLHTKKALDATYPLKVVCTQPRRVAAMNVAKRVADEMGVRLGRKVGYSVRFEECTSQETQLKFATDGMLMREIMSKRLFEPYGIVILDEAHERTLNTDILMGLLKETVSKRSDLKIIIMSATVNTEQFRAFLGCPSLEVPGRMFPVETYYVENPSEDYVKLAIDTVVHIHQNETIKGDILVFLTGQEEIEHACAEICRQVNALGLAVGPMSVLPLYSNLSVVEQQKIFSPAPFSRVKGMYGRKCVVSTNIAETSLTIQGIRFVVDAGFCKRKCFSPESRIELFQIAPISRASADQRKGRAGRTSPGVCYRLYTEEAYKEMNQYNTPEIMLCNLASLVLLLKRLGIENLVTFDYMSPPYPKSMIRALDLLYDLGAINEEGQLTEEGQMMCEFPVDPPLSKMLIMASRKYNCAEEILSLVSLLSVPSIFVRPFLKKEKADEAREKFTHPDGDHLTLINVFNEFVKKDESFYWCRDNFLRHQSLTQASNIRMQLTKTMEKLGLPCTSISTNDPGYSINIRSCILEGCFTQVVAQLGKKNSYICVKDGTAKINIFPLSGHSKSPPRWLVYHEFIRTYRKFVRTVSPIDPKWLFKIAPHYYNPKGLACEFIVAALTKKSTKEKGCYEETKEEDPGETTEAGETELKEFTTEYVELTEELVNDVPNNKEENLDQFIADAIQSLSML